MEETKPSKEVCTVEMQAFRALSPMDKTETSRLPFKDLSSQVTQRLIA